MNKTITTPDGQKLEIDYFVEWRPWLWVRPLSEALEFLGDLRGKRLLEIGGRSGRMSCLLALRGAEVTMLEMAGLDQARAEADKWGLADRVRLVRTQGDFAEIQSQTFDAVFTKSVLWRIEQLGPFLDEIDQHLAPGGKVAFVENRLGGRILRWLRRNLIHRGDFTYERQYVGIRADHLDLFRSRFEDVTIGCHRGLVYTILGRKKSS